MEYQIRPFKPEDLEDSVKLLEIAFEGWPKFDLACPPIDHFKWKFLETPEKKHATQIAVHDDTIVGFNSHIYTKIKIGNTIHFCSRGADTAVHSDHRRKGLFSRMETLEDQMRLESGTHLHYGVSSNPIVKKYHYKSHAQRDVFPKRLKKLVKIFDIDQHLGYYSSDKGFLKSIIWKGFNPKR